MSIHYEVEGDGPALVLQHGFSSSLGAWRESRYVDELRDAFRLLLVDARGHGSSGKPHELEAYTAHQRVDDVLAVLDAEDVDRAHFWGYSMGGRIGFGLLKFAPERAHRVVIGGMHAYERDAKPYHDRIAQFERGMTAYVERIEQQLGQTLVEPLRTRLLSSDAEALIAATRANLVDSGLDAELDRVTAPTLIYCGTEDAYFEGARRAADAIPNARFVPLDGLNHMQGMQRAERVLPSVVAFLNSE